MTWHLLLILAIATLFYVAFPAVGAVVARARWRTFRRTVTEVSRYPTATSATVGRDRGPSVGFHRFFGTLEAIQGNDRIWITNGRFSVAADLRGVHVYLIPEEDGNGTGPATAGAELGSVPWNRIFSLPEGTPVFVGGAFITEEGRGIFRDHGRTKLLVVIHDCPRESILMRAIGSGRQRNEYMNAFTLPSVGIGSLLLILLAFSLLGIPERFPALVALTAGLAPIAPFLPPGFPLYFAYRSAWKKARLLRAQRDIVRLPLRYFPPFTGAPRGQRATLLPDMEPYLMMRGRLDPHDPDTLISEGMRIALPPAMVRVEVDLPGRRGRRAPGPGDECVLFSGYTVENEELRLGRADDPMAAQVLVPGIPEAIARASENAARSYAALSALLISLNMAVNVPLVFILLWLLIH